MAAPEPTRNALHLIYVTLRTVAISAVGGGAFAALGFPAPWISGGMVAVAAATLSGIKVAIPAPVREVVFFVLGVSIGSALSPESITGMAVWPLSVILLVLGVPVVTWGGAALLMRRGWPRNDAMLATAPGALATVLIVADSVGAHVGRVALVQTLRLAILVVLLPILIALFTDISPVAPEEVPTPLAPAGLALVTAVAVLGAIVARLLRLPAGTLVGAMVGSGILYASGHVAAPISPAILTPGLIVVGAFIGTRFAGMTMHGIRRDIVDGLYAFVVAFAVSMILAVVVTMTTGLAIGETILAFAPGGFEVMIIMAFSLGLDAAYVAVHHTIRIFVISLGTPLVFRNHRKARADVTR